MKLAYIWISEHKVLKNIQLSIDSSCYCDFKDGNLTIRKNESAKSYYNNVSISAIIGKNGTGKSTVLEFLEDSVSGGNSSGIIVWYDDSGSVFVCPVNFYIKSTDVLTTENFSVIDDYQDFLSANYISLIKSSNLTDANRLEVIKKNKSKLIYDLSLSDYQKQSLSFIRERFSRLMSYLRHYSVSNDLQKSTIKYTFKFSPSSTAFLRSVLDKFIDKNIGFFEEKDMELLHAQFMEYHNNNISIESQLIKFNISLICQEASRKIKKERSIQDFLYLILMISYCRDNYHFSSSFISELLNKYSQSIKEQNDYVLAQKYIYEEYDIQKIISYIGDEIGYIINFSHEIDRLINGEKVLLTWNEKVEGFYLETSDVNTIFNLSELIGHLSTNIAKNIPYGWEGFSTGEFAKLNLFSELYYFINNPKRNTKESYFIFMDEVDLYLHPDWQRNFLSDLLQFISKEFPINRTQILMTSHSPIIIGDFLPENIITLIKNDNGIVSIGESHGFGTQITDLYINGLHIESTFGVHSKMYIEGILRRRDNGNLTEYDHWLISKIKSENIRKMLGGMQ
ncbi:AAA family ATPase [Enterobacter sp. RHBSTW-00175]|uniref:AAA family ATPase n=1 Tax=Enterobacter sp. RHBSTW-00175 TaxID=2742639 RepID=UPI0015EA2FA2|nr:AAA family ATPase [Enterobacter sp. RHBSTW-00175]QMR77604.1 AAA family ATPase [Enterobacter sp. RHBSTW-00175]